MTKKLNFTKIKLIQDRYNGIIIDNSTLPKTLNEFEKELIEIISNQKDKKLMWITLAIGRSDYIPLLTKYGFVFFDCNETTVTLLKRLADNPIIPTATNHTIGVGAAVIDKKEILVIKDRSYKRYKLPGGYIDNKENISQALIREVFEETGINVELESIVSLGHFSPLEFHESNIYIVCRARPLSKEIDITDDHEIIEAKWINIDQFLNCEEVHIYNKKIVEAAMQNEGLKLTTNDLFINGGNQYELFL